MSARSPDVDAEVRRIAARYVWWQQPGDAPHDTRRLLAQVMDIGTHSDAEALRDTVGDPALRQVLRSAEPGWFSPRSWHYWHYALGLAEFGDVPDLPRRRYA